MQVKYIIPFVCISALVSNVNAAITEAQEKLQVQKVMQKFIETIACKTDKEPLKVHLRNIQLAQKDSYSSSYYVLWESDLMCAGGSGTQGGNITLVEKYGTKPFVVNVRNFDSILYAFGESVGFQYEFVQSIKRISDSEFEVVSWGDADDRWGGSDGGENFPANKFRYILKKQKYNNWKIVNQVLLEQKK